MKESLTKYRFEILLALVVMSTAVYAVFTPPSSLINWYSSDDAFYYFKTAQNITEGSGVTFDGLGRDSGFHPLWMVICIPVFALARFDLILPLRILVLVSGIINAAAAILLYRLLAGHLSREASIFASLLWCTLPHIQSVTAQMGMESTINALCVILLINLISRYSSGPDFPEINVRSILGIGLAAALTLLSRLDNLFLVGMMGLWFIFRRTRLRWLVPAIVTLIIISAIAGYYIRLEPGAEYYQYSDSLYFMIAGALAVKLPLLYLFKFFHDAPSRDALKGSLKAVIREAAWVLAPAILSAGVLALLMTALQASGLFAGFPRMALVYDSLVTLAGLIVIRGIHTLTTDKTSAAIKHEWKKWLIEGIQFAAPIIVLFGAYLIWNLLYFGTALPVSGQIKHWWGSLPNPIYGQPVNDLRSFFGFLEKSNSPWSLVLQLVGNPLEAYTEKAGLPDDHASVQMFGNFLWVLFSAAVLWLGLTGWKRLRNAASRLALFPLFTGCLLQIISYFGTGYINTRPWYWVIEMILIIIAAALLTEVFLEKVRPRVKNRYLIPAVIALAGLALFIRYNAEVITYLPMTVEKGKEDVYRWGARGLEETTEPGALIGSTGGGVIAYFIQDRTIVNLDGLMNTNEYFERLQNGSANEYLDRIGLDYVYASKYVLTNSDPYMGLFGGRLEFQEEIFGSGLYRYLPGK